MDCNHPDSLSLSPTDIKHVQLLNQKRVAPDAAFESKIMRSPKPSRKRASKACQCCHSRKVRCNVLEHGAPCTNCRLDQVECIVFRSKKRKNRTAKKAPPMAKSDVVDPITGILVSAHPPYGSQRRSSEYVPGYQVSKEDYLSPGRPRQFISAQIISHDLQCLGRQQDNFTLEAALMLNNNNVKSSAFPPISMYPAYIKPLPDHLSNNEIAYLQRKGALRVPNIKLRDELIHCYAQAIHPFMPQLDLQNFVSTIHSNDATQRISLLLFQSVMSAGIASVDIQLLEGAGYTSRREAQRDFWNRARTLYDINVETDDIALIQSLLIMTYRSESQDDHKDSYHWMSIAVSLAQKIGLHRDPGRSAFMEPARQRLRKRIWWSAYMRDRIVTLGSQRLTRIKAEDFDVPMLTLDDFESITLLEKPPFTPKIFDLLHNAENQRQLAVLCIEMAKLCVCISDVLSAQHLMRQNIQPKVETATEMETCDQVLQNWKNHLPKNALYIRSEMNDMDSGEGYMILNRSLLYMFYYSTLATLHRPQVLTSSGTCLHDTKRDDADVSRRAFDLAVDGINLIISTLYKLDLVRFLPITGIAVVLPSVALHLLNSRTSEESSRPASLRDVSPSLQTKARPHNDYATADYSIVSLEQASCKACNPSPGRSNDTKEKRGITATAETLIDNGRHIVPSNLSPAHRKRACPSPTGSTTISYSNPSGFSLKDSGGTRHPRCSLGYADSNPEYRQVNNNEGSSISHPVWKEDFNPDMGSLLDGDSTSADYVPMTDIGHLDLDIGSMVDLDALSSTLDEDASSTPQSDNRGLIFDFE